MSNPIQQARELGQSTWYDNIRRGLITSGELAELIEFGITGMTSNPTIFEKAIAGSTDYDAALLEMVHSGKTPAEAFEALALQDIRGAADLLRGVYDETDGADGYVSLEVPPTLAHDTSATVAEAHRLFGALDRPNVMIKVPATPQGAPAIRQLIADGINTNVTLVFSLDSYRQVMEAYISGMEELVANGGDPSSVASVASFFVSRVDTAVDALLHERIRGGAAGLRPLLGKAAIANAPQGLCPLPPYLRPGPIRGPTGPRRPRAAPPVGQHQHQGPSLPRHPLRRFSYRPRHRQHHAAGHRHRRPGPRPPRRHPRRQRKRRPEYFGCPRSGRYRYG